MPDAQEGVVVTQADREAAADWLSGEGGDDVYSAGVRDGFHDGDRDLVQAFARHRTEATRQAGWQPIETAPRDGTDILAWCVHANAQYADPVNVSDWQCPVVARWIDHNGGGWTWHGLCGSFTHWQPLPPPPTPAGERRGDAHLPLETTR